MNYRWLGLALSIGFSLWGITAPVMAQPSSDSPIDYPSDSSSGTPSVTLDSLDNTEWLLEDLAGHGVLDHLQTTIRFEEGNRITGSGGCNRYFAGAEREGDRLSIGIIGSTRRMCPDAVMNQENQYFRAMESATTMHLDGSFLYIESEAFEQPLRFTQIIRGDRAIL